MVQKNKKKRGESCEVNRGEAPPEPLHLLTRFTPNHRGFGVHDSLSPKVNRAAISVAPSLTALQKDERRMSSTPIWTASSHTVTTALSRREQSTSVMTMRC
ncbi:uncharacterized protein FOMMEDRAFT_152816 [Fomitiporia mediterranea MF3/22]|uniref:uncharacterized protein n=1 Tax=Fomitiporia mediterranea (strain MF3/22) TaxID=694068 RepID=UPI00044083A1|nr:uncharacterized protein FOMMEDRAFT_152816 [Fomitiporia mediterranea MF3/22]EJD05497.1 hypothetical protein FOMMEDRAFT_152816 [Fomitiporia mediterranea MF3/22]